MCSEKSLLWIFSLSIQGLILNSIQGKATSGSTRREVIYIGDGGGDFCPSLQLQKGDHVLARKGWEPSSMNSNLWGSSETQPSTHVLHGRDAALEGTQQFFSSVFFFGCWISIVSLYTLLHFKQHLLFVSFSNILAFVNWGGWQVSAAETTSRKPECCQSNCACVEFSKWCGGNFEWSPSIWIIVCR